ncbi:NAD-dependent epimerase/dehydratase family protein [Streptococcus cristatus]|jgi:UDP-glucose 4-epimerase BH3715|uniref:NAD-dependent epimerase/dehydratase family protein n=1 Tax=Streptococcus cristatus TaxID=45634 RepID=UPI0016532059|nr:NAD-dependent epimerase/dehydratase family protein [Streptococcus cristatus]MBC6976567.1 NAD-dependent epimerase/dehydratase family protein [Streptococcus cristatus]
MKKVLITGKGSYIGRSFLSYVSDFRDITVEELDVHTNTWEKLSFSGYDVIFHVAALVHLANPSQEMDAIYHQVNTQLPFALAKKAKEEGVTQFIFMSSMSVYGDIKEPGVITKNTIPAPQSLYGRSKLEAEKLLLNLSSPTFNVAIVRPPMVYGLGAKGNYQRLSSLANKLLVFPRVNNSRSMIYIDNLSEFIRLLIKNEEAGTFHPQNSFYVNTSQLVKEIRQSHGKSILLLPGFNRLLRGMGRVFPVFNKLFSDLVYAKELSDYPEFYQLVSFSNSIKRTERNKNSVNE